METTEAESAEPTVPELSQLMADQESDFDMSLARMRENYQLQTSLAFSYWRMARRTWHAYSSALRSTSRGEIAESGARLVQESWGAWMERLRGAPTARASTCIAPAQFMDLVSTTASCISSSSFSSSSSSCS
eukprot:321388-Pyramimonas_sp.AAC.1